MATDEARALMQAAWATRRRALEAPAGEQLHLLARAKQDLEQARAMCSGGTSPVPHAQAIHLLANVERDLGDLDAARSLWEEAVQLLRGTDDALQLAHKVRHLGDLHRQVGRLADAEACFAEALELYREHDGPGSLDFANAVSRMAELTEHRGDTRRAIDLWRETRDLYAAVDLGEGVEQAERHIELLAARLRERGP